MDKLLCLDECIGYIFFWLSHSARIAVKLNYSDVRILLPSRYSNSGDKKFGLADCTGLVCKTVECALNKWINK